MFEHLRSLSSDQIVWKSKLCLVSWEVQVVQ